MTVLAGGMEVAWFAGLFEGEGNICCQNGRRLRMQLGSTDLDVLQKIQAIFGGRIDSKKVAKPHYKPFWVWEAGQVLTPQLAPLILPFMGSRRTEQITKALDEAASWVRPANYQKARKTCPKGHKYDFLNSRGARCCRRCTTEQQSESRRRRKAA